MAERVTTVCDHLIRGNPCPEEPATYYITGPIDTVRVDLCDRHANSTSLLEATTLGAACAKPATRKRGITRTALRGD